LKHISEKYGLLILNAIDYNLHPRESGDLPDLPLSLASPDSISGTKKNIRANKSGRQGMKSKSV